MKTTFTRISTKAWVFVVATGLCAALNAQAGKPAPPPAKPAAIVYTRTDGICTMAADGSSQKCIIANIRKGAAYFAPVYSPDGKRLALFRSAAAGVELCTANADGTGLVGLHTFVTGTEPDDYAVVWSPDGSKLMFTIASRPEDLLYIVINSPGVVMAVPVDVVATGTGLAISKDLDPVMPGYQGKLALSWYSDESNDGYITLASLSFDSAGTPQLGSEVDTIAIPGGTAGRFAWSPNGEMLAYSYIPFYTAPTRLEMLVIDWQGGGMNTAEAVVLDPGVVYSTTKIAWSPDGQYLAYGRSGGYNDIFRGTLGLDADGLPVFTSVINLTNTPKYTSESSPDWSPAWVPGQ